VIRVLKLGAGTLLVGVLLVPVASAAGAPRVPDAVTAWFENEAASELADLEGVSTSDVVVGRPVPEVRLRAPKYDLESGTVIKGDTTLEGAILDDDRYCALVQLPDTGEMCVQHHKDGSVEFTDLGQNLHLLPEVTELPTDGFVNIVPGVGTFGIDLGADTVTALDESAKVRLPQGKAEGTAFLTALGKYWAERIAYEKKTGNDKGAGGGAPPEVFDLGTSPTPTQSPASSGSESSATGSERAASAAVVSEDAAAGSGRLWVISAITGAVVAVAAVVLLGVRRRSRGRGAVG